MLAVEAREQPHLQKYAKKGQHLSKMGGPERQRFVEGAGVIRVMSEGAGEAMDRVEGMCMTRCSCTPCMAYTASRQVWGPPESPQGWMQVLLGVQNNRHLSGVRWVVDAWVWRQGQR